MSESFIEPESLNSTLVSLDAILDEDGAVRLLNKELSSYNFDGVIPTTANTILVSQLEVGMSFLPIGETEGALRTVVKVEFDDPQMTSSPTNNYIISYLSANGDIESVTYDGSQNIEVYFEDWDDKVLGTKGWLITQEGNAIFSNVAVRGRIEATEGLIDGDLIVTGSLSTSETADTTGGIVFDSDGIFAYNTSGTQTFSLDSATGDVTIFGTPGNDLLIGSDLSDTGTTVISANRITTGSVTGRVFRSNSSMTPATGTGVYLDGSGSVRFSNANATFTFSENGLSITGGGVKIGGANPDDFLVPSDVGSSGTTTISGDRITTGALNANLITTGALSGWTIDTSKIYTSEMTFDSANSRISVGPTNSPIGILEKDIAGTGISLRCDATTTAYGGTFPLARIDVTDQGSTTYGNVKLQAVEFFGRGGAAEINLVGSYPFSSVSITGYLVSIDGVLNTITNPRLKGGTTITDFSTGNTVASISNAGVFTGNGSGLTNIPAPTSIPASSITSGTLDDARIPSLAASKITSGTFDDARIPNLAASKITSGVFAAARVENVNPANFSNAQTTLQIRTSDNRVGFVGSTLNIKENILPLTGIQSGVVPEEKNALGKINLLINPNKIFEVTPVEYSIVGENPEIKEIGFIVEDLLEKWPAAVSYDKDGKPQSYNTNSIVAGLVYAVSTLKKKIEELQNHVLELESSMET